MNRQQLIELPDWFRWENFKVRGLVEGESGPWKVVKAEVGDKDSLYLLKQAIIGRDIPYGRYTMLKHRDYGVVMSDTPSEIRDHSPVLIKLVKRPVESVLITGLGLGMVLKAAMASEWVTRIDVIEKDPDVIKLVGPTYMDLAQEMNDIGFQMKLNIIEADAWTYEFPDDRTWDIAWHDIWFGFGPGHWHEYRKMMDRWKGRVGWQDAWGRMASLRLRIMERTREAAYAAIASEAATKVREFLEENPDLPEDFVEEVLAPWRQYEV